MIDAFGLAPLRDRVGRGFWPFFQESIATMSSGDRLYLDPEETFGYRLRMLGVTPIADTSLLLRRRSLEVGPGGYVTGRESGYGRAATSWFEIPGFFDFAAVYDAAVAAAPDPAVFVEVGCLLGRSTCYLASKVRESGKAITVYAVDTGRGSPSDSTGREIAPAFGGSLAGALHRNILGCGLEDVIVPIVTDSVRAARLFAPGSVDFGFIDGDHAYESVAADLRAWWPAIRPGGMLAGHDYRQPAPWLVGVTPAVHEFFGVAEAAHLLVPSCWAMTKSPPG